MKIGYARKSTHLQDVAHQVDELTKAGCEQIYQDQTSRSGPKRDKKGAPELENCLKGVSLDIENYCTLRLFFDLPNLAGLSRRNLPADGIRLLFHI
ncbi:recombinase family protein [Klebsiella pneumoniae]|uniref:recombinase family protein n=1 Tax=Klebsiella pneumoniae TaxID=573 RepID=UPI0021659D6D|nr:recombinase family protein [Klebsiella pneumoniae]